MSKSKGKKVGRYPASMGYGSVKPPCKFRDRDLASTNPLKDQFEPTESEPVRQHHRMAGNG